MRKPQTIWVKNNGPEHFKSRFDGEDFSIAPGEEAEMLVDCAALCLGFGEDDKSRCLRRLGWAFTHDQMAAAEERLAAFSFHMKPGERAPKPAAAPSAASAPGSDEPGAGEESPAPVAATAPAGVLGKLAAAQARAQAGT